MKKYKATDYGLPKIAIVEIEKETGSFVFIKSGGRIRREAKQSRNERYCDTFEEAKAALLEGAESDVSSARRRLEQANAKLGNIKGMKKPAELA
jgi:hypothetical protein